MEIEAPTVGSVFTPGRMPQITYNPRDQMDVEGAIRRYLMYKGAALTVSGPTKSGKTVVVERLLPRDSALWVSGGDLRSVDDLWTQVVEYLGLSDQIQNATTDTDGVSGSIAADISVPGFKVSGTLGGKSEGSGTVTTSARRPLAKVAREALQEWEVPVVIDDFHYVPEDLKLTLIRAIKGLIEHSAVVLIAVPQEAFRAVREETDMLGRVWQLEIRPWSEEELLFIAKAGFSALNLVDEDDRVAAEFARTSLGAPFLMQQLCLDYCIDMGIHARTPESVAALMPEDVKRFYSSVATRYIPGVFDSLRMGPRTKGQQRLPRALKDGRVTDIYGAVLYGMSQMGPVRQISTQQLARTIGEHFTEQPQSQNVASALGHMKKIADEHRGTSDAALDYKNDQLYIADPFLSFYLRFGNWELPNPPVGAI